MFHHVLNGAGFKLTAQAFASGGCPVEINISALTDLGEWARISLNP